MATRYRGCVNIDVQLCVSPDNLVMNTIFFLHVSFKCAQESWRTVFITTPRPIVILVRRVISSNEELMTKLSASSVFNSIWIRCIVIRLQTPSTVLYTLRH